MENSLVRALSSSEFKKINKKILEQVGDVLGNSADAVASIVISSITSQPILTSFYSLLIKPLLSGNATFRDYVELERIATFYDRINEVPFKEREAFSQELERDNDLNFTKNLLYSVSQLRNLNEAKIAANLFTALIKRQIEKGEFQSLLNIIHNIDFNDLIYFKDRLDIELNGKIDLPNKKKSLELVDMLMHNPQLINDFKDKRSIFISNGLIKEEILVQNVPEILGNYNEPEAVAKLRKMLSMITIVYSISRRGAYLYIYGFRHESPRLSVV